MPEAIRIAGFAMLAAIAYGILHDQVTAHICVEYFTVGHPRIIESRTPFVLALVWGFVATWWVGLPLGAALAFAVRAGSRPKLTLNDLRRSILALMAISAGSAALAGTIGGLLSMTGTVFLVGELAQSVPPEKHTAFLVDLWAHSASYVVGALGGLYLLVRTFRSRRMPFD